jgi:hypothetical protein
MPKYEVHTTITAYNIYCVEAESKEDAEKIVMDAITGKGDLAMGDRILDGMAPDGYGDDESVYRVDETV